MLSCVLKWLKYRVFMQFIFLNKSFSYKVCDIELFNYPFNVWGKVGHRLRIRKDKVRINELAFIHDSSFYTRWKNLTEILGLRKSHVVNINIWKSFIHKDEDEWKIITKAQYDWYFQPWLVQPYQRQLYKWCMVFIFTISIVNNIKEAFK
jgi:hypothetical protein